MADVHGPGDQLRHLQIRYHLKSMYTHLPNGAMNATQDACSVSYRDLARE